MVDDSSLRERFVAALEEAGLAERRDELLGEAREWVLPGFHDAP